MEKKPFVTKKQIEEIVKNHHTPFHIYDETGHEKKDFKAIQKNIDGANYTEVRLPEDWSAAIIRKGR